MAQSFSGQRLRDARLAAGIRRERLAVDVGRSVHSIEAYEHGLVTPPLPVALLMAAVLGCSLDDLLTPDEVSLVA